MKSTVVVNANGRVAEVSRQRIAVVVSKPSPLQVVHRRAVDQDGHSRGRPRKRKPERIRVEIERLAAVTQAHFDCQRIPGLGQVVANHAVLCGEKRFALWTGPALSEEGSKLRECAVEASAHELRDAANALVGDPGERKRRTRKRFTENRRTLGDGTVHRLDHLHHGGGRLDGKLRSAAQGVRVALSRHSSDDNRRGTAMA